MDTVIFTEVCSSHIEEKRPVCEADPEVNKLFEVKIKHDISQYKIALKTFKRIRPLNILL